MVNRIKRVYGELGISEFLRFWDASINHDYVNNRIRELVRKEEERESGYSRGFKKTLRREKA